MLGVTGWIADPAPAFAQQPADPRTAGLFDIAVPSLPLAAALAELSRQTGISIGAIGTLPHVHTQALFGRMRAAQALDYMLAGTGYAARQVGVNAWRIVRAKADKPVPQPPHNRPEQPPPVTDDRSIVVTATKESESLGTLSRALSLYTPEGLHGRDGAAGTATVAAALDGLTLTGSGPGRNLMFLRGVVDSPFSGSSQSTVAVLLDGVRLTYSAPDPDLRLVDVKRVEVLKGPQGTLYGQGALGGIYQVVSNRPDPGQVDAAVAGGLSMVGKGGAGYSGSGMLNLPLLRDRAALRLVGYGAHDGGWIDTGTAHNTNSVRALGGRAALALELDPDWRIDARGAIQRMEAADTQYTYASGSRRRPAQNAEPHDNDLDHVALHIEGRLGSARLVALSGLTWHEVKDRFDATQGASGLGLTAPAVFDYDRRYRVWDNELRLSGSRGGLRWLAGLSHVEARQDMARTLTGTMPTDQLTIDSGRRISSETALFANLTVPIGADLSLEGGARLFHGVIDDQRIYAGQVARRELSVDGLTPGLAISWRPSPHRTLFLRYGSARRQGGLGLTSGGLVQPLDGDELATIEGGWHERLGASGTLDVSVFHTSWSDLQSDMLLASGLIETRNAGMARLLGAELSVDWALGSNWQAGLGVSVQNARLVRNALGIALDDRRLPVVPSYTLRSWLRRDFRVGSAKGWLRVNLRAIGPARLSFDPALDRPMGNYRELGAELHLSRGSFEWGLDLSNLLFGHADVFPYGNPFRIGAIPQYTPQRPTRISAVVAHRF